MIGSVTGLWTVRRDTAAADEGQAQDGGDAPVTESL